MEDSKALDIKRHDTSADKSLRPHSAADEYLLRHYNKLTTIPERLTIYNDRFGYLSCHLNEHSPITILTHKSQEKAILLNLQANKLPIIQFSTPLSVQMNEIDYAIMKAPKSLELFHFFLEHIVHNSTDDVTIVVAFMTRHFSPKLLSISETYFQGVEQSKAIKKSRLLTLTKKREVDKLNTINIINYNNHEYRQYWGVFSAQHIDYATQFFLEHLELNSECKKILDLASGNGVIAKIIKQKLPDSEIHLLDDSFLAVESSKLNIEGKNIHHHYSNDLSDFEENTFDLIVTNPPFHFEYEVNIQITLKLFIECYRCLKSGGNLQIVASRHLNYMTHLMPLFQEVKIIAENDKFIIYKCMK